MNNLMPRIADAVGAFDRENPPAEGSTADKQMMSRFEGHSRTAMGFVWLGYAAPQQRTPRRGVDAIVRA